MTTVLICEDNARLRAYFTQILRQVTGLDRVEWVDHADVVGQFSVWREDCLVVVGSSRGRLAADTVTNLLAVEPRANVLAVGGSRGDAAVCEAITDGVGAYLRWDAMSTTLLVVMARALTDADHRAPGIDHDRVPGSHSLTSREIQVLVGISEGLSNGSIGRLLALKESTVKSHAHRIFAKIGVSDRAHAVAYGFRHGILK